MARAARLLCATKIVLTLLPVGAVEIPSGTKSSADQIFIAQQPPEIPVEVQGWVNAASAAYKTGDAAQALRLQLQPLEWARARLSPAHPFRAEVLNKLSVYLSAVGQRAEALSAMQESVKIYRELANTNPAFLGDLAESLNNIGTYYREMGLLSEALSFTQEGASLFRDLASINPAFLGALAAALNNIGLAYRQLGRRGEVLAPSDEAVKIYRQLTKTNQGYLGNLAASLSNLGASLSQLGRRQEALAPTEEAVKIFREMAKDNPAFLGNLALSLTGLGVSYSELGRRQEALAPTEEAVKIFREIAKTNPAYQGDLAASLNNLGIRYSELGWRQKALAPAEEAVKIFREMVKTNPAFLGDLAGSLNSLGNLLSDLSRRQEAQAFKEEAVKIRRELAKINPAFLGDLARSLDNFGLFQLQLGQPEIARNAYEESIAIIRPMAASNPVFEQDLQRTLNYLEQLNRQDGIRIGASQVLEASDVRYLPKNDPSIPVKRAVVRLWPTFSGKKGGPGLLGTGFVVQRQGDRAWIATVLHVVRDLESNSVATKVEAELFTGPLPPGLVPPRLEVVLNSGTLLPESGDEPIILEVRGLPPDVQPLQLAPSPPQGVVTIVGHPTRPGPWSVVHFPLMKSTAEALLLDGGLVSGASGSPVLSAAQQVVGVVYDSPEVSKNRPIAQTWAFPVRALAEKMK
jgi:tetratricopeptide (TPR) repeat protein